MKSRFFSILGENLHRNAHVDNAKIVSCGAGKLCAGSLRWRKNECNKHVYFTSFILMYYFRIGSRRLINSALNYLLPSVTELKVSPILQPKYSLNRIIFYFSKNKKIVENTFTKYLHRDDFYFLFYLSKLFWKTKIIYTLIIPFFFSFLLLIIHTEERIDTEFYSNFFVKYAGKGGNSFPPRLLCLNIFNDDSKNSISYIYLLNELNTIHLNELKYSLHFALVVYLCTRSPETSLLYFAQCYVHRLFINHFN